MLLANLQEAGVDIHDLVIEPLMVPQSCQVLAPHVDAAACVLCTDFVTRPDCPSAAHLQVKPAYGMHGGCFLCYCGTTATHWQMPQLPHMSGPRRVPQTRGQATLH